MRCIMVTFAWSLRSWRVGHCKCCSIGVTLLVLLLSAPSPVSRCLPRCMGLRWWRSVPPEVSQRSCNRVHWFFLGIWWMFLCRKDVALLAFYVMRSMWWFQLSYFWKLRLKYFAVSTSSKVCPWIVYGCLIGFLLFIMWCICHFWNWHKVRFFYKWFFTYRTYSNVSSIYRSWDPTRRIIEVHYRSMQTGYVHLHPLLTQHDFKFLYLSTQKNYWFENWSIFERTIFKYQCKKIIEIGWFKEVTNKRI